MQTINVFPWKRRWILGLSLGVTLGVAATPSAETFDPSSADYSGRRGKTIYVSKLGDNSDGSTWQKAFHTIQAALLVLPDNLGGHQVIIRPGTYVEANLYSGHPGARGAYNLMTGDCDGRLGSGATGWVIVDSSCPGVAVRTATELSSKYGNPPFKIIQSDQPESGLKSVDWWGPVRCAPDYSTDDWDRWIWRNLYATGSEGGFGWAMTDRTGVELSGVMENCVGIGRFSGTCIAGHVGRKDEPILVRHCYFANLDWWGDAGGVYVRGHHTSMPDYPDAVFEDCTIVSPDNALQVAYPNFNMHTRVRFKDCRLITLSFSQPGGTPGSGIICCDIDGKYLHVDLEDCLLMGYRVFGRGSAEANKVAGSGETDPSYSLKGKVSAYVHYRQPVPKGFERLGLWPVEVFSQLAPPMAPLARK